MAVPKAISVVQKTPLIRLTEDSLFLQLSLSSKNSSYSTRSKFLLLHVWEVRTGEAIDIYLTFVKGQRPKDLLNVGRQVREADER
jgi:hypothetical protein